MLRLMKTKAKAQNHEREPLLRSKHESKAADTYASMENTHSSAPAVMVSHVPVSVGSRSSCPSSASSISSKGEGIRAPIEQNHQKDFPIASSHHAAIPMQAPASNLEESLASSNFKSGLSRKLSLDEDCQVSGTGRQREANKRARLDKVQENSIAAHHSSILPFAPVVLLARDQDDEVLSPLHAFIRKQIEVFTATPAELAQPAPGRKHPILLRQVGLRCIHCRDVPSRKRVKRAVCYPRSVARVYHSVSDMKFDHFGSCLHLPSNVRATLEALKSEGKRGNDRKVSGKSSSPTSSTAQYYHDMALQLGMVDDKGGIFMVPSPPSCHTVTPRSPVKVTPTVLPKPLLKVTPLPNEGGVKNLGTKCDLVCPGSQTGVPLNCSNPVSTTLSPCQASISSPSGLESVPLASLADEEHLNPLHCFVRQHIEVFSATEEDITAPAPGRKTRVSLGQVGIRCIHCAGLPLKDRVKRAVCYPPSTNGIYHSASNMKFDHFSLCKGLPLRARIEFTALKMTCTRRGTAGNNGARGGMANSTAQYYRDSAVQMGLVDTASGIRFGNSSNSDSKPIPCDRQPQIPSGMTALMMAVSQTACALAIDTSAFS